MGQGKKTEEELDNLGRRLQKNNKNIKRIIKKNDTKIVKFEASDSPKAPLRANNNNSKRFSFNKDLNIKDHNESEIPISNKRIKNVSPSSYSQKLMEVKSAQPVVASSPKMLHYPSRKQEQPAVIKVSKLLHMQRNDNFPAKNRPPLQIPSIRRDDNSRSPGHSPREASYDESNRGVF